MASLYQRGIAVSRPVSNFAPASSPVSIQRGADSGQDALDGIPLVALRFVRQRPHPLDYLVPLAHLLTGGVALGLQLVSLFEDGLVVAHESPPVLAVGVPRSLQLAHRALQLANPPGVVSGEPAVEGVVSVNEVKRRGLIVCLVGHPRLQHVPRSRRPVVTHSFSSIAGVVKLYPGWKE